MIQGLEELDKTHPELSTAINALLKELFGADRNAITADWTITEKADETYKAKKGQSDNVYTEFFRRAEKLSTDYATKKGIEDDFGFTTVEE